MSIKLDGLMDMQSSLRSRAKQLEQQLQEINKQLNVIDLQIGYREHPCPCVKLNKDLGVYNMTDQAAAGRRPFDLGLVGDCLSADESCPQCHGTGKPNDVQEQDDE